ncbi:penicillin-binding protein 1B [Candidatus Thiosymbion oneisti]|uniref:penicillin-binding protein 1B n=1 Tax=Candidatus Thiosymbion oneisti TaxID=589554 RepID=UPI000AC47512|nr:penicillin-binding protein 1B [Candidatus Thiosymbion oneisti]
MADRNQTDGGVRRGGRGIGGWRLLLSVSRWVLLLTLAAGLAGVLHAIHLDGTLRAKFEGKRWALPARVFARPLELYVGRPLSVEALTSELERLRYRRVKTPNYLGSYSRRGDRFLVHTRPFRFWDGPEPERILDIRIKDGRVAWLKDTAGGVDPALVRLDAVLIASIYPTHNEDRVLIRGTDLPPLMVAALLAVEDRDFYRHWGVNPRAIARAMWRNLRAGGVVEGGSTLTQQLVKNFYLTDERTLTRKLNEAVMAVLLDLHYGKDEILEAYVNEIFLGQDGQRAIHGFGLASHFYFNRSLDELGIAETALLVALIKGPSFYHPRRYPERALARRNLVIDMLREQQVISAEKAAAAKRAPLGVSDKGGRPAGAYPAYLQLVRHQLQRDYREQDLRSEGLRIFTTLDLLVQAVAEAAVRERVPKLERGRGFKAGTLESAAVVTSAAQGEVLALVGGRDPGYAGFNRALDAVRPIGSLIKPVVYLTALSEPERYSLVSLLSDRPVSLRTRDGKRWEPRNYDRKTHGRVPLYQALAKSYNLATVNLGLELGLDKVVAALDTLGVRRPVDPVPALLLGSVSLTPLEVSQIYQTLAAGGFYAPLRAIREVLDAAGQPLSRYPLAVEPVADAAAVYLTTWAMQQVVRQGTARALRKRLPAGLTVAGKTGTTNGQRDSWFAGFSGDKVLVVWVGRDDNGPTKLTGASGALRIWGDIMTSIENRPLPEFRPEGVTEVRVDPVTGLLADVRCRRGVSVPFSVRGVPTVKSGCGLASAAVVPRTADRRPPPAPVPRPAPRVEKHEEKTKTEGAFDEYMHGD